MLPWLPWIGDWALKWTEGNTTLQIVFVMFIFPLIMNAIQYYIVDSFIKEQHKDDGQDGQGNGDGRAEENEERGRLIAEGETAGDDEEENDSDTEAIKDGIRTHSEREPLKEVNPTPLPSESDR